MDTITPLTIDPTRFDPIDDEELRDDAVAEAGWGEGLVIVNMGDNNWACNVRRLGPSDEFMGRPVYERTYLIDDATAADIQHFMLALLAQATEEASV
jgi:hypothetical protein